MPVLVRQVEASALAARWAPLLLPDADSGIGAIGDSQKKGVAVAGLVVAGVLGIFFAAFVILACCLFARATAKRIVGACRYSKRTWRRHRQQQRLRPNGHLRQRGSMATITTLVDRDGDNQLAVPARVLLVPRGGDESHDYTHGDSDADTIV